jgi:hypothetical protein
VSNCTRGGGGGVSALGGVVSKQARCGRAATRLRVFTAAIARVSLFACLWQVCGAVPACQGSGCSHLAPCGEDATGRGPDAGRCVWHVHRLCAEGAWVAACARRCQQAAALLWCITPGGKGGGGVARNACCSAALCTHASGLCRPHAWLQPGALTRRLRCVARLPRGVLARAACVRSW